MADSNIKISLELVDKAAQKALSDFISKSDQADKNLNKLKDSGKDTFNEIAVHIGKSTGIFDIFAGNLAANLVTKAFDVMAEGAHALFDVFIVEGVKAAEEQEKANQALNIALAQTGIYSKETAKEFEDFASRLQATTGIQDDVISQNAALIQSLGRLDKEGLQRATEAAINLSAALGKDLATTSEALGKAANGNTTAIHKMGISFREGGTDAQTFKNILEGIEKRFDGAAAQKVNTYAGAIDLTRASFGDLQEEVGNAIVKNNVVIEVLKTAGAIFRDLTDDVNGNGQSFKKLVGESIIYTIDAFIGLAGITDTVSRAITAGFRAALVGVQFFANEAGAILHHFGIISKETSDGIHNALSESLTSLGKTFTEDTGLGKATELLARLREGAIKGFDALNSGATTSQDPINNTAKQIANLTDEQKKLNEETKNWAFKLAEQTTSAEEQYKLQTEMLQAKRDAELISDQEFHATKLQMLDQRLLDEESRLDTWYKTNQDKKQTYENARLAIENKAVLESVKQQKIDHDQRLKAEQSFSQARVDIISATANLIAAVTGSSSNEAFYAMKAAALAQAIVATNLAAAQALAVPPAPNFGLAGLAKTAGYINIAAIAATAINGPKFENGGIVPGNSFNGDSITARVNSGEMILNRSQQAELFKVANGQGSSGNLEAKVDALINVLAGKDERVIVNIGGRTIVDSLRSELSAGRSFA